MLIDTHCHLDYHDFETDRAEVIARATEQGVTRIIIPATDAQSGAASQKLAEIYPGIYFAAGIHPNSTAGYTPDQLGPIETLAKHPRCVAIGEIGLDYYRDSSPKADQHQALKDHLDLAARLGKPVILHNRESSDDLLAILEQWVKGLPESLRSRPGVLHSFSGSMEAAQKGLALGFYLGFTGPITFKNAEETRRIAAMVPLDRLLVETDAPFLAPQPHRGKRNEPGYVRLVAERIAALRNLSDAEFFAQTTRNAERLFMI